MTDLDLSLEKYLAVGYLLPVPTFGENLRQLRLAAKLKGYELAEKLEVTPPVVSAWENDRGGLPELPTLFRMANALNCFVEDLIRGVDAQYAARVAAEQKKRSELASDVEGGRLDVGGHTPDDIPVIAEGEASPQGHLFWDNEGKLVSEVEDRITRPHDVADPRAYGLRVRGDSMVPIFRPKMVVVVSPSTPVSDGDEVYVELTTGERLVKTASRATGGWVLESANPAYAARFVKTEEIGTIHPIVWSKRKESGRRVVDEVKRKIQARTRDTSRALLIAHSVEGLEPDEIATVEDLIAQLKTRSKKLKAKK